MNESEKSVKSSPAPLPSSVEEATKPSMKNKPHHVKVAYWIEKEVKAKLHDNESVVDIAFRSFRTALGPPGWGIMLAIKFMGETRTQGLVIVKAKPTKKDVSDGLSGLRKLLDQITFGSTLTPKPGEISALKNRSGIVDAK